ncbi:MAG: 50S ribosomal protein L9 [Phycisphaerae bacterium]
MKLLLCKNIDKLGIVGDIVDVAAGFGRNYLLPKGFATEPTDANIRALAEARKVAELERVRQREQLEALGKRLEDVEVTVRARANEEGVLYGSVGAKEISAALVEEGHPVVPDQVALDAPIRHLDNVSVDIKLADDLKASVKVWVVREKSGDEAEDDEALTEEAAGTEAGEDGDSSDE